MPNDEIQPKPQTYRNFADIWEGLVDAVPSDDWYATINENGTLSAESFGMGGRGWQVEVGLTKVAMYIQQGERDTVFINSTVAHFPREQALAAFGQLRGNRGTES